MADEGPAHPGGGPNVAAAEDALRAAGLVLHAGRWLPPIEIDVTQALTDARKLQAEAESLHRQFQAATATNRRVWEQRRRLAETLEELTRIRMNTAVATTETYQAIERLKRRLNEPPFTKAVDPAEVGELPSVNDIARDRVAAYARGGLATLRLAGGLAELEKRYAELDADDDAQRAFAQLAPSQPLSPRRPLKSLARDLEQLRDFFFDDGVPYSHTAGRPRTTIIIGDRRLLTVTLREEAPSWIPASAAVRLSLPIDRRVPQAVFTLDDRRITVRKAQLKDVRIGPRTLETLPVWVLPPEAEDLGASLAVSEIHTPPATLDKEQMWLAVEAADSP